MGVYLESPIRAIIADSDALSRQKVTELLATEDDVEIIAECSGALQAFREVQAHSPDLLVLEIPLPGGNTFELLRELPVDSVPLVVFTTMLDQYAVKAFEIHVFDYLLKPVETSRFRATIRRVREHLRLVRESTPGLSQTDAVPGATALSGKRLVVKSGGRITLLDHDEIDWIEAAANYIHIHGPHEALTTRGSLSHIARRLPLTRFARIHRRIIVNLSKVVSVYPCNSGEYVVVLRGGRELPCSRNFNSSIRALVRLA